jgi:AcrR family transcriptional regulator
MTAPTPVRRTGRAAPMAPDERRRAIVEAVVPLLLQHGGEVSTRQIAEAAGIAEGTIFRVFPDKSALLVAAARETVDPADGGAQLAAALEGVTDLRQRVVVTADRVIARSQRVMAVLMAVRQLQAAEPGGHARHAGPPTWLADASRSLQESLTTVFEPHRDELRVEPARAAMLLRTLVLGSRHPGAAPGDRLTGEEIADVLLDGVRRTDREGV